MTLTSDPIAAHAVAERSRRRLVVAGAPGAGKGTQCPRLAGDLGVPHISTGDLLRDEVRTQSALGTEVAATMARGGLLPDALVLALVGNRLTQEDADDGFVLDGFPRTSEQARALCNLLGHDGLDLVIELVVSSDHIVGRLAERLVCGDCDAPSEPRDRTRCGICGGALVRRSDDEAAAVHRRLAAYRCYTEPMLRWFERRNQLVRVDGNRPADAVSEQLRTLVTAPVGVSPS
jgi:adenylate kinase